MENLILLFLFIAAPSTALLFLYAPSTLAIPLLLLLGFTAIPHTPVCLAFVQDFMPDNRALVNGLFLAIENINILRRHNRLSGCRICTHSIIHYQRRSNFLRK